VVVVIAAALWPVAPATADDGDALAIVNGRPISQKKINELLMEAYGLRMLQQVIALDLARQETHRRGLEVTADDVQAQYRQALKELAPRSDTPGAELGDAELEKVLDRMLREKCLTRPEFMLAMERNAHLRKAAESTFEVSEATLREEFARTYGAKVEVRHIAVAANDTRTLHEVIDRLGKGDDFATVARDLSANRQTGAEGGLLPAFTFTERESVVPATLREVAFQLAPGEVSSPTLVGEMIHILKLERRIPPENVRFEDVRDKVEATLRERVVRQKMGELMDKIFREAEIRILDRRLKREFDAALEEQAGARPPSP
jgi:peptidyl-prolyl cis-trans isomerase C